ncbi:MAG: hypothetical protein U0263_26145 [Polyangiaceae bacterium]
MVKTMVKVLGLFSVVSVVACASASDGSGTNEPVATDSEELPCTDCGPGGGGYEPSYPYDNACASGEGRWNSASDCAPSSTCVRGAVSNCIGTPSATVGRCGSNGCGTSTNTSSTNPCYNHYWGSTCTLSGGYTGHCYYDFSGQLACFNY